MPGEEANPTVGEPGKPEFVEEDRVEVVVNGREEVRQCISELRKVRRRISDAVNSIVLICFRLLPLFSFLQCHPYEEVAYDVYRLEDF